MNSEPQRFYCPKCGWNRKADGEPCPNCDRDFDSIPGRKYLKVAEWLGSRENGQRTVRWFKDMGTGTWYAAESWKRPNLRCPLNAEQTAYVESVVKS